MSRYVLIPLAVVVLLYVPTATVRADLVGWWPFDEDVEDHSGNENHGFTDFPVFDGDVPDAIGDGQSLSFDGNVGVEVAPDPSLDSEVFTLSMFILNRIQGLPFARLTSRQSDTFETALGTGGGGDQLKYYSPRVGWNATVHEVPFEEWQHVAYVSDGLELTIYADGEVVHGPVAFQALPTGLLSIGNRWNNVEGFVGLLDDVALFDQPLDIEQIESIADVGIAKFLETFDPDDTPPARPTGLVAEAGDGRVHLRWDSVENADGYNVYRADLSGGPYDKLNQDVVPMAEYVDDSVDNDVRYYYVVTSVRGGEESLDSAEIAALPRAPLDDPTTALVGWWTFDGELADRSGNQNHGTMTDPEFVDDVPDAIGAGKALRFDGTAGVAIAEDPSLDSDTFTLAMFIYNHGQGLPYARLTSRGSDSFEAALGTGGAGDQLKYFSRAEGSWNATPHEVPFETWQHVAYVSTGTDLTIYADGEAVHGPVPLTTTPSGVMHIGNRWNGIEGVVATLDDVVLFDAPLSAEQIAAMASSGVSEFLGNPPPPDGPPVPPTGLRAESGDGRVALSWDEVAEATGYGVHRSEVPGGPYEQLNQSPLATTTYVDADVENGTLYYYVVTAVNGRGESRASPEVVGAPRGVVDAEDALVGWWPFDESLDDESGLGHDGLFELAVYDENVPEAIGEGTSLSFDGSGGVEIAPSFDLDSEVFTLSMFVLNLGQAAGYSRTTSRGSDVFETAIGTGAAGDQLKYYSPANGWNATPHEVPFDVWQHVAYVADGATITVYADGEVVHGPVPFAAAPSGVLRIGNRWNGTEGFIGLIDDVALFNAPLSREQISTIAEDGTAGLLEFTPSDEVFVRGDANADGGLNITDAVFVLEWLFGGGAAPGCRDAADANDDSGVNIADAVFLLDFLFGGGGELPAPTPPGSAYTKEDCGPDPTDDPLDCAAFEPCD